MVRNRLYSSAGRFELELNYSFSVANALTATQGPMLDASYHISESWAIDLLVAYMFGGPTDLFGQAQCPGANAQGGAANCLNNNTGTSIFYGATVRGSSVYSDLPSLWTLNGLDAQVGVHWEPVYGKLSLVTAVPVHFKWYIGIYGGVAQFSRDSFDFCTSYSAAAAQNYGDCATKGSYNPTTQSGNLTYLTLQENQWSWVASAATGLKFIFLGSAAINAGLREYVWGDSYRVNFTTADFSSTPSSSIKTQSGITPSLFADLGLSWTF